jgi:hypothetical protein
MVGTVSGKQVKSIHPFRVGAQYMSTTTTDNAVLVPRIEGRIQVIRGLRVMIDTDLAALFGVETKRLNEQIKRNRGRLSDA